ncbi:MAG: hypothetical protein K8T91_26810 [Planctomycetes bacterium]|nr:hypothetical protein [Planctomycetota bacterium]
MANVDEFQQMWDGSEPGWRLVKVHRNTWRVIFHFGENGASKIEMVALRKILNELRDVPPEQVWRQLQSSPSYEYPEDLGNIESCELVNAAQSVGLAATAKSVDRGGYLPIAADGSAMIIEDDELAEQVTQKMIASGVPIEQMEVD